MTSQNTDKIPRKYKEIWDRNTKHRFGIGISLVYQIFCYRLTSLPATLALGWCQFKLKLNTTAEGNPTWSEYERTQNVQHFDKEMTPAGSYFCQGEMNEFNKLLVRSTVDGRLQYNRMTPVVASVFAKSSPRANQAGRPPFIHPHTHSFFFVPLPN